MATILAQRIKAARRAIHPPVTQREVAKRFKLSPSAVCLWESGETQPSAEHLAELSRWFQVSTDWMLGVDDTRKNRVAVRAPIHTVPVVAAADLVRWHWNAVVELLQTAVSYPPQTAAGLLVDSDALTSVCPTGCYAVVSKGHPFKHGQIVLASVSRASDPVLRKYIKEGRDELLVADDVRFPTYRMNDNQTRIIGRVTEVTVRRTL